MESVGGEPALEGNEDEDDLLYLIDGDGLDKEEDPELGLGEDDMDMDGLMEQNSLGAALPHVVKQPVKGLFAL